MLDTLHEIHRFLVKNDALGQALVVHKLIALHDADRAEFLRLLQGGDLWGGSGAVWEVARLGPDTAPFWQAVIALADEMERDGMGTEHSRFVAKTLRRWRAAGLAFDQSD